MERLFGSIPAVLRELGGDGGAAEALAMSAWPQCAGELIAERSVAQEYFENRLIVAVKDATWRSHLEDLSPQLVARLNAALGQGTVKFIEFRVDPNAFEQRTEAADEQESREVPLELLNAASQIRDEELRQRFIEAAAVYLSNQNGR